MKKKVSIKDVAKQAGVSTAAVSYCLNGIPGQISKKTEDKILRVAARLNYVPSFSARGLALGKTDIFGVVTVNLLLEPFTEGLKGIEEQARKRGVGILIGDAEGQYERESTYADLLLRRGIEGIIFISASSERDNDFLFKISKRIPVVLINRPFAGKHFHRIVLENRSAIRQLVSQLIARGEKEIVFLSPSAQTWAFSERLKGYQEAMEAYGLAPQVIFFPDGESNEEREEKICSILRTKRFSAFVCGTDYLAVLVWRVAYKEGIRIPQDISLTGFDDIRELSPLFPAITTVKQPFFEAGMLAVDILMKLREGKKIKKEWRLESQIIWRESVKNHSDKKQEVRNESL